MTPMSNDEKWTDEDGAEVRREVGRLQQVFADIKEFEGRQRAWWGVHCVLVGVVLQMIKEAIGERLDPWEWVVVWFAVALLVWHLGYGTFRRRRQKRKNGATPKDGPA